MDDMPLIVKVAEVVVMEGFIVVVIVALLIAAVRDIVDAKVRESRRHDQIAVESEAPAPTAAPPVAPKPAAVQPGGLSV